MYSVCTYIAYVMFKPTVWVNYLQIDKKTKQFQRRIKEKKSQR